MQIVMTIFLFRKYYTFFVIAFIAFILYCNFQIKQKFDKQERVLIVFSIKPGKCQFPIGEKIFEESFVNKQQYAKIQDFDLIYNNRQPDRNLTGNYNKIAILREILNNQASSGTTIYEWLLWIDSDALILDMSFKMPFSKYNQYNLVLWGDLQRFKKVGDAYSLNTGVFLLRNNKWSRKFLEIVATFGHMNGKAREEELKRGILNYNPYIKDQNGFVYTLKYYPQFMKHVYFETGYGLNRYWKEHFLPNNDLQNSFIVHFCGCRFCTLPPKDNCEKLWNFYLNISEINLKKHSKFM